MAKTLFETLDDIEWAKLNHSYDDSAEAIPQMLRDLAADNEDSHGAFDELFELVWHPESLSEATSYTIPFVIEIIEKTQSDFREDLLILLKEILSGKPTSKRGKELFQKVTEEARKGAPVYLSLLTDDKLQIAAIELLSVFPDACDDIAPKLLDMLDEDNEASVQYTLLETLFTLTSKPKACSDKDVYHKALHKLQESEIKGLKLKATTALIKAKIIKPGDDAFELVKASVISPENYVLPKVEPNPLLMSTIREDSLKVLKRLNPEQGITMLEDILEALQNKAPQADTPKKASDKPSLFDAMKQAVKRVTSDMQQDGLDQFEMDNKEEVSSFINLQGFIDNIAGSFPNFGEGRFSQFTNNYANNDFGISVFFTLMYFGFGKDLKGNLEGKGRKSYPSGGVEFVFSAKGEKAVIRHELAPVHLQALKTIAKYDMLWTFKSNLLEINGLPQEREALVTFINRMSPDSD